MLGFHGIRGMNEGLMMNTVLVLLILTWDCLIGLKSRGLRESSLEGSSSSD